MESTKLARISELESQIAMLHDLFSSPGWTILQQQREAERQEAIDYLAQLVVENSPLATSVAAKILAISDLANSEDAMIPNRKAELTLFRQGTKGE